jgi:hypothetical protein
VGAVIATEADILDVFTWRPILTAPRDGTAILLWEPGIEEPHIGRWSTPPYAQWWSDSWAPPTCDPTHWMPLPAPPQSQNEVGV